MCNAIFINNDIQDIRANTQLNAVEEQAAQH